MSLSTQEVFDAALELPAERRAELADRLLASLEAPIDREIAQAWAEEADRRMEAYRQEKMEAIPADEAWERINARWTK
jgi:putative addiction module component (TIGR02574 family)